MGASRVSTRHTAQRAAATTGKTAAKAEIDRQAEAARRRFVTPGSGQLAVYLAKAEEARDLQVDGSPDPANYPLLAASIGIEGESLSAVAGVVLAQRAAWLTVAAAIENKRLGAKAAIDALADPPAPEDLAAILTALSWPAP